MIVARCGQFLRRLGLRRARRHELLDRLAVAVPHHCQREALVEKVAGHSLAHQADADEADAPLWLCSSSISPVYMRRTCRCDGTTRPRTGREVLLPLRRGARDDQQRPPTPSRATREGGTGTRHGGRGRVTLQIIADHLAGLDRDGLAGPARLAAGRGSDAGSRCSRSRARWATATIAAPPRSGPTAPISSASASTTSPIPISPSCWPRSRKPPRPMAARSCSAPMRENLERQDRVLNTLKEYRPDGMIDLRRRRQHGRDLRPSDRGRRAASSSSRARFRVSTSISSAPTTRTAPSWRWSI